MSNIDIPSGDQSDHNRPIVGLNGAFEVRIITEASIAPFIIVKDDCEIFVVEKQVAEILFARRNFPSTLQYELLPFCVEICRDKDQSKFEELRAFKVPGSANHQKLRLCRVQALVDVLRLNSSIPEVNYDVFQGFIRCLQNIVDKWKDKTEAENLVLSLSGLTINQGVEDDAEPEIFESGSEDFLSEDSATESFYDRVCSSGTQVTANAISKTQVANDQDHGEANCCDDSAIQSHIQNNHLKQQQQQQQQEREPCSSDVVIFDNVNGDEADHVNLPSRTNPSFNGVGFPSSEDHESSFETAYSFVDENEVLDKDWQDPRRGSHISLKGFRQENSFSADMEEEIAEEFDGATSSNSQTPYPPTDRMARQRFLQARVGTLEERLRKASCKCNFVNNVKDSMKIRPEVTSIPNSMDGLMRKQSDIRRLLDQLGTLL